MSGRETWTAAEKRIALSMWRSATCNKRDIANALGKSFFSVQSMLQRHDTETPRETVLRLIDSVTNDDEVAAHVNRMHDTKLTAQRIREIRAVSA